MANWSNPTLTSTYTNFVTEVKDRDIDCATLFDGSTSTNLPAGTKRWNATNNKFEKWSGSAWSDLSSGYAINITGTAANVTGTVAVANGGTGVTSSTGSGSVVLSNSPTLTTSATVPVLIGGTGIASPLTLRATSGAGATGADIVFQTGNNGATEAMRILNNGSIGIGTTSPKDVIDANGRIRSYRVATNDGVFAFGSDATPANFLYGTGGASGYLSFWTGSFERARIDASGNLGIGTTSPSAKLSVSDGTVRIDLSPFINTGYIGCQSNHPVGFITNNIERVRIGTSGDLLVAKSASDISSVGFQVSALGVGAYTVNLAATNEILNFNNTNAGNIAYDIAFRQQISIIGSIRVNATSVAYNTTSDYRLKDNIRPIERALEKVSALRPVAYTWKANGSDGEGFIAHELQQVCPQAVTGNKDEEDETGRPRYQAIDPSKLIGLLTAAIQELKAEIDALKSASAAATASCSSIS